MANFISFILKNGKKKPLKKALEIDFVAKFHNFRNFSFIKWEKNTRWQIVISKDFFPSIEIQIIQLARLPKKKWF